MVNAKRKDVQKKEKPEAKKPKVEEEEEEDSGSEEVEVKGKKGGKDNKATKAEPKKKAPAKKQEDSDSDAMSEENGHDEKPKPTKGKATEKKGAQKVEKGKKGKEEKKDVKKKKEESEEEEESDEEEEEEKGKKGKKVEIPKKETKKAEPPKKQKPAESESEEDDDDDEEEEEEPKKKAEPKKDKKKEESEDDDDEDEEDDKKKDKSEEDSGFVIKSAANASPFGTPKNQNRGGQNFGGARTPGGNEPNTRVYVGNLSFKVTDDDIKNFFSDCGTITEIKWMMDRNTGKFRGAGHLEFDSLESSKKAVAKNGEVLLERPISIDFATPMRGGGGAGGAGGREKKAYIPRQKTPGSRTIFLGGCPDEIQDDDIYNMFGSCGEIEKIRWVHDKNTNKFKGCGFVVFSETDATDKAVALNGTNFKGRSLRIDFADD